MKIRKKLIRNVVFICLFVFSCLYFNGLYFSVENCVHDTLNSLYDPSVNILFQRNDTVYTFDENSLSLIWVHLDKVGPFYKATSVSRYFFDSGEQNFETQVSFIGNNQMQVVAYRFNPQIDHIDIYYGNEKMGVLEDWNDNITYIDVKEMIPYTHRCLAYDDSNHLIEEKNLLFEEE